MATSVIQSKSTYKASSGDVTLSTASSYKDITTLSLEAGIWVIDGDVHFGTSSDDTKRVIKIDVPTVGYVSNSYPAAWYSELSCSMVASISSTQTVTLSAQGPASIGVNGRLRAAKIS